MITIRWETALALFWLGAMVEAALGNWMGRLSDPRLLLVDAAVIVALLVPLRGDRRSRGEPRPGK